MYNTFKLPSTVKRIINYIRKSREEEIQEEREGFDALERQRIQMERVVQRFDVPYDEKKEVGSGDKIELRPVFQSILKDLEKGKYQAIAVREIQRLGRGSYEDMGQIYTLLETKRIYIITETRVYDLRDKDDAKFIRMQLFLSREEYFFIKERLQGAREYFAGEGRFMSSRPPYGYVSNHKTKKLEINPEQAKYVSLIFDWYAYGDEVTKQPLGYQAIATRLTNMGVKTYTGKRNWQPMHISAMLRNKVYIGYIIYKATERTGSTQIKRPTSEQIIVPNAHPPIVSLETFELVQKNLETKKKKSPVVLEFDPCELAGLVTCRCGKKMVRQYSTQKYKKKDSDEVSIYHKEFLYCRGDCKMNVKYRDVENNIIRGLSLMVDLPEDELYKMVEKALSSQENQDTTNEILNMLEKQKKALEDRLKFAYEQYEDQIYSKEEFIKRRNEATEGITRIDIEIENEKSKKETQQQSVSVDELRRNLKNVVTTYSELSHKSLKNELLKKVIDDVTINIIEKGRGSRPSKLQTDIVLTMAFIENSQK